MGFSILFYVLPVEMLELITDKLIEDKHEE